MDIKGTYLFDDPPETVWARLMDPAAVAACLPGCEALEPLGDDRYRASLKVGVAGITGTYQGTVTIADRQPPASYRMLVEGSGRPGFVKGASTITLTPEGGRTRLDVTGDVQVGGLVARVGQRLLAGVARMTMDRFFECLRSTQGR